MGQLVPILGIVGFIALLAVLAKVLPRGDHLPVPPGEDEHYQRMSSVSGPFSDSMHDRARPPYDPDRPDYDDPDGTTA